MTASRIVLAFVALSVSCAAHRGSAAPPGPPSEQATEARPIGSLEKSVIDGVIQQHLNQIRYCYQRVLATRPDLYGELTVSFVIAPDGTVSSSTTRHSTLEDESVETCIHGRFLRFQFPEPEGGGIIKVHYPFVFEPGASPTAE